MLEGISEYQAIQHAITESCSALFARKHLLAMLLARRRSLRVICAPAHFGKSVLAYQYAHEVFADDTVCWINASEPVFLVSLDALRTKEDQMDVTPLGKNASASKLFIIDDCPTLDAIRFSTLCAVIEATLNAGDEVILATKDTRWTKLKKPYPEVVDAQLLLLGKQEQDEEARWTQGDETLERRMSKGEANLRLIVGYPNDAAKAHKLFFETLMDQEITSSLEALSLIMLILERGALHELNSYVETLDSALMRDLEHAYPYVGITPLSPLFSCAVLSEQERFMLLRRHLQGIRMALGVFESDELLVECLLDHLLKHDRLELATQLACGLPQMSKRIRFFDMHAASFLYAGKPLALLALARTLPREQFVSEKRKRAVVLALALIGEVAQAQRLLHAPSLFNTEQKRNNSLSEYSSESDIDLFPELNEALVYILLVGVESYDRAYVGSLISSCVQKLGNASFRALDRPRFSHDLVRMLAYALENPLKGFKKLQALMSSGYSMKENLFALCAFARMLLFVWNDRLQEGAGKEQDRAGIFDKLKEQEQDMLKDFEHMMTRILARAATLLEPNSIELLLFASAHLLFGARVYLFLNDAILSRIQTLRESLSVQCHTWRQGKQSDNLLVYCDDESLGQLTSMRKKALRINMFGRFEIEARDPDITIRAKVRKQLRLLISLLAINAGREVSRPWIQQTIWPNSPDRNARQSLYSMWSLLNKSILDREGNCPFFESYPQSVALNSALVETDTQLLTSICKRLRYETLDIPLYEKAIEMIEDIYRGPLLPGDETAEVVASRKQYHDRLIEALVNGGEQLRKTGETALALRYFRFAFDNEPTREDVCYLLMLTLWKLGRHGEALNEYFVCRRALVDRFGIEGTAKLRKLYDAILADAS